MTQGTTKGVPIDTDPTLGANSNQLVPSQAAVVTYVGVTIASNALPVTATENQVLLSNNLAAPEWSTATYPPTAGTSGNVLTSDGTNWLSSTPSSGFQFKESVIAASNINLVDVTYADGADVGNPGVGATLTYTGGSPYQLELDGILQVDDNRALIKNQTNPAHNGIYDVTFQGSLFDGFILTRAQDHDTPAEMDAGVFVIVDQGVTQGLTSWVQTTSVVTVGATDVDFSQLGAAQNTLSIVREQTAHGFAGGEWVYFNGTNYVKTIATGVDAAETAGVVASIVDNDNFVLQVGGFFVTTGLTSGQVSFLSAADAGELTATPPTTVGQVVKPQLLALSATIGLMLQYRGELIAAPNTYIEQDGSQIFALDAQASDAYVITLDPVPAALVNGMVVNFFANTVNTGNATLNVNALGAKNILKNFNQTLADEDIKAGQLVTVIFDSVNDVWQMQSQLGNAGGGGASSTIEINQTAHGFAGGEWVYNNAGTYTAAIATSAAASEVVGVVSAVAGANDFTLQMNGYTESQTGLTANTVYFLSTSVDGELQTTEPSVVGEVIKPLLVTDKGAEGTTSGVMLTYRGNLVEADSSLAAATQAQQETGTSTTTYVSPGRQQFHPSAAKAWCEFTGITTTAILSSYNISMITDNGTGTTTLTFTVAMSSDDYCYTSACQNNGSDRGTLTASNDANKQAATIRLSNVRWTPTATAVVDMSDNNVSFYGDQ